MRSPVMADLVRFVHYVMVLCVFLGPFLPRKYLPYYMFFILLIFLDWNDLDGMCILTKLEHSFRSGEWVSTSPVEGGPEFFRPILQRMGFSLTRSEGDRLNNFVFLICWFIAFVRYFRTLLPLKS
jgi:hypothetical protein